MGFLRHHSGGISGISSHTVMAHHWQLLRPPSQLCAKQDAEPQCLPNPQPPLPLLVDISTGAAGHEPRASWEGAGGRRL